MSLVEPGDQWSVGICDDVIVWEFASKTEFSAFTERNSDVFRHLVGTCDVRAVVTILDFEGVIEAAAIDAWGDASRIAAELGVSRWAIVARDVSAAVLEGTLDTGKLETRTTDDRTVAIDWARSA